MTATNGLFLPNPGSTPSVGPGRPFLDTVIAEVGDEHGAVPGNRDGDGVVEFAGAVAGLAEGAEEDPVANQPLKGPKILIANGPPHLWEKRPSGANTCTRSL